MKHSKDSFEAAIEEEQDESPPESPGGGGGNDQGRLEIDQAPEETERDVGVLCRQPKKFKSSAAVAEAKNKDEDEEEEEENMEAELTKYPTNADPAKMAKMQ
ncbi:hypothetical protein Bca4012_009030 [Brassica carinata]|uniref:Uncharacterized protein n=1 Tax=Brassica carinata TaxID=52824 RepID=A0A8X7V1N2_BRACI|nr:hypothetical protein Bca52824_034313 [Brassica carinata]